MMLIAMSPPQSAPPPPPAQPLVFCRVSIRMHDGSRGAHEDWYPHACDAIDRALTLFPEAQVISVAASRGIRRVTP